MATVGSVLRKMNPFQVLIYSLFNVPLNVSISSLPFRFFCKNCVCTWGVHVLRSPNFFSGMEADRNVEVVGGDVAVL